MSQKRNNGGGVKPSAPFRGKDFSGLHYNTSKRNAAAHQRTSELKSIPGGRPSDALQSSLNALGLIPGTVHNLTIYHIHPGTPYENFIATTGKKSVVVEKNSSFLSVVQTLFT